MKRLQLSVMMIQSYTLTVSGQTYSFQRNEKYLSGIGNFVNEKFNANLK